MWIDPYPWKTNSLVSFENKLKMANIWIYYFCHRILNCYK